MTGVAPCTELGDLHESRLTVRERSGRKESICAYCNQLVIVCLVHCVTVTCRRPIATGSVRQITELASAPGERAARQVPARRQDLSYGAGLFLWRDWLVPGPRLGSGSAAWLLQGRKAAGIRTLSSVPAATRPRDLLLRSSRHGRR